MQAKDFAISASRIVRSSSSWLLLATVFVVALVVLALAGSGEIRAAMIGLIGVAVGSVVSNITSVTTARETAQAGITGATWAKRVETHQAAFGMWRKLLAAVHGDKDQRQKATQEAYDWWEQNCLYSSSEARVAFFRLLTDASLHELILHKHNEEGTQENRREVRESWDSIMDVGRVLIEGSGGHISDEMLRKLASPPS